LEFRKLQGKDFSCLAHRRHLVRGGGRCASYNPARCSLTFGIDKDQPKPCNVPDKDLNPAATLFRLGSFRTSFRHEIADQQTQKKGESK